jgi:uncharacterized membrane protein YjjB (DUF3815 family)
MAIQNYVHEGAILAAAAGVQGAAVGTLTKRVITAAALVNTTAAPVAASVYLVPSGGAADASRCLISARTIAPGETYFCPELINQGLSAGGTVQALGAGLTFRYTGRDLTNG